MTVTSSESLALDGFLKEWPGPATRNYATTFQHVIPKTEGLPEVTVGLGVLLRNGLKAERKVWASPLKPNGHGMEYEFATAVEEKRQQLSHLPNWQERLLLEMGYARNLLIDPHMHWNTPESYNLFGLIPENERDFLLKKHGFHKIATMVAHGHTQNLDSLISTIEELETVGSFASAVRLMALGVPLEDLPLAVQMPEKMAASLYNN